MIQAIQFHNNETTTIRPEKESQTHNNKKNAARWIAHWGQHIKTYNHANSWVSNACYGAHRLLRRAMKGLALQDATFLAPLHQVPGVLQVKTLAEYRERPCAVALLAAPPHLQAMHPHNAHSYSFKEHTYAHKQVKQVDRNLFHYQCKLIHLSLLMLIPRNLKKKKKQLLEQIRCSTRQPNNPQPVAAVPQPATRKQHI